MVGSDVLFPILMLGESDGCSSDTGFLVRGGEGAGRRRKGGVLIPRESIFFLEVFLLL